MLDVAALTGEINRILIVRPSALGDVCRTVPVLVSLRRAFPGAQIDWVVRDTFTAAVEAHPALDRVIAFPRMRFSRFWRDSAVTRELWRWLWMLRRQRYDLVIDCQGLSRSALISLAAGAPQRIGPGRAREFGWLAYTRRVSRDTPMHTVDEMLALLSAIDVEPVRDMQLYVEADAKRWWTDKRRTFGATAEHYAVLAPTARWISKRWPADRWRELIENLQARGFDHVVVIGAPDEAEQVEAALPGDRTGIVNLAGQTSIAQTMAVIADASLLVAHDSAPLHIAAGFDRPCIGLYGPTDPNVVGPLGSRAIVVGGGPSAATNGGRAVRYRDPNLGDTIMRTITVEAVLDAVDRACGGDALNGDAGTDTRNGCSVKEQMPAEATASDTLHQTG